MPAVNHLGVPPMDLTVTDAGNGKLKVELQVPASSGSKDNIPFLEVTRNEQRALLNGAQQDLLKGLSQSGFTLGPVKYEAGAEQNVHGGGSGGAKVPGLGKVTFEISSDSKIHGGVNATLNNNPDLKGAISTMEKNFDIRRQDIYEGRAREWAREGGATINSNGQTYTVSPDVAKNYVNERHPLNPFKRASIDEAGGVQVASASPALVDTANSPLTKQLAQAVQGAGDKDTGARAFEIIKDMKGYSPNDAIHIVQGNNGTQLVAQRPDQANSIATPVTGVTPGDFERVSTQVAKDQAAQQSQTQPTNTQQQNQAPLQQEQEARKGPSIA
jgi:hypothetical protein